MHTSLSRRQELGVRGSRRTLFLYVSSYCFSATVVLLFMCVIFLKAKNKSDSQQEAWFGPQLSGSLAVWPGQTPNFCGPQFPHLWNERMRPGMLQDSLALLILWNLVRGCAGEAVGCLCPQRPGHQVCLSPGFSVPRAWPCRVSRWKGPRQARTFGDELCALGGELSGWSSIQWRCYTGTIA